jgi:hypothetical protein
VERLPEHQREDASQEAPAVAPESAPLALQGGQLDTGSVLALQRSAGNAAVGGLVADERSIQRALARSARSREQSAQPEYRSTALALRSLLRTRAASSVLLQRTVTTSGGDWDTEKYDLLKDVDPGRQPARRLGRRTRP